MIGQQERSLHMELLDIQETLHRKLEKKRYDHTLGVMYTSAALCMQHGLDINKGLYAGLLHDCAKAYKSNKQFDLCKTYKIKLNHTEKLNHALIHAKLGSYLAEHEYKINDNEILSAILCHTTGKPNMSTLEKILYISDYIEPHRRLPRVEEMRVMAFQDLDLTMYHLLDMSIEFLNTDNKKVIDEMTLETYTYYKQITTK